MLRGSVRHKPPGHTPTPAPPMPAHALIMLGHAARYALNEGRSWHHGPACSSTQNGSEQQKTTANNSKQQGGYRRMSPTSPSSYNTDPLHPLPPTHPPLHPHPPTHTPTPTPDRTTRTSKQLRQRHTQAQSVGIRHKGFRDQLGRGASGRGLHNLVPLAPAMHGDAHTHTHPHTHAHAHTQPHAAPPAASARVATTPQHRVSVVGVLTRGDATGRCNCRASTLRACTRVCVCTSVCVCMRMPTRHCMCMCMCMRMSTCVCVCVCVCAGAHILCGELGVAFLLALLPEVLL